MFPLSQKRRFARVDKLNIEATVKYNKIVETGIIENLSASGCKLILQNNEASIDINSKVDISFTYHGEVYNVKALKVRESAYSFSFEDKKDLAKLNTLILTDYFNDEPELREILLND